MAAAGTPTSPSQPTVRDRIRWFLGAGWVERGRVQAYFDEQHRRDEVGHRIHTGLAMLWLAGASLPISVMEFIGIPLAVCFFIRAWSARRTWPTVFFMPLVLLLAAWTGWGALTLAWSRDPVAGLEELSKVRWGWSILFIWPVIDRRRWLVGAYAAGFLLGNMSQVIQAVSPEPIWDRDPARISGWWRPVVAGSLLTAALGMHLAPALMGRGRTRAIALAGAGVTVAAILATGTRGAWVASAGLVMIATIVALWRYRGRLLRPVAATLAVVVIAGVIGWMAAGPRIVERVRAGISEVTGTFERQEYGSDVGARLIMNWWAMEAFLANPIGGVGVGGYRPWVVANLEERAIDPETRSIHDHAHSTPLHIAATTGAVGLAIAGCVGFVALHSAWRGARAALGTYQAGPFFALLGLYLAGLFDTIHVNTQTAAHLMILFSLCPAWMPEDNEKRRARSEDERHEGTEARRHEAERPKAGG